MTKEIFQEAEKLIDKREYYLNVQFALINARSEDSSLCAVHFNKNTGKSKILNNVRLDDQLQSIFLNVIKEQIADCEEKFKNL